MWLQCVEVCSLRQGRKGEVARTLFVSAQLLLAAALLANQVSTWCCLLIVCTWLGPRANVLRWSKMCLNPLLQNKPFQWAKVFALMQLSWIIIFFFFSTKRENKKRCDRRRCPATDLSPTPNPCAIVSLIVTRIWHQKEREKYGGFSREKALEGLTRVRNQSKSWRGGDEDLEKRAAGRGMCFSECRWASWVSAKRWNNITKPEF